MKDWNDAARLFSTTAVGHLATLQPDGAPQVVPLWIDRHGDERLVFFSGAGSRKDRNVTRDPRIAISITAPDDPYVMAAVRGTVVERVEGEAGMALIDGLSQKYAGKPYDVREGLVAFVVEPTSWWSHDYGDAG